MTTSKKFSLLAGTIWNLKRWIELKQFARRNGNAAAQAEAQRHIEICKDSARKIRSLQTATLAVALLLVCAGCKNLDLSPDNPWKHTPGNPQYQGPEVVR